MKIVVYLKETFEMCYVALLICCEYFVEHILQWFQTGYLCIYDDDDDDINSVDWLYIYYYVISNERCSLIVNATFRELNWSVVIENASSFFYFSFSFCLYLALSPPPFPLYCAICLWDIMVLCSAFGAVFAYWNFVRGYCQFTGLIYYVA